MKITCTKKEFEELIHILSTHEPCPSFCKGCGSENLLCADDLAQSIEWEITE